MRLLGILGAFPAVQSVGPRREEVLHYLCGLHNATRASGGRRQVLEAKVAGGKSARASGRRGSLGGGCATTCKIHHQTGHWLIFLDGSNAYSTVERAKYQKRRWCVPHT